MLTPILIQLLFMAIGFIGVMSFASRREKEQGHHLVSRPIYYGLLTFLYSGLYGLAVLTYIASNVGSHDVPHSLLFGGNIAIIFYVGRRVKYHLPAREEVEKILHYLLFAAAGFSVLLTAAIVLSVIFEAIRFFGIVPPFNFLLGLHWSPQSEQMDVANAFGAIPLFAGTLLIMLVAMVVAVPIGLFSAIYTAEYASPRVRAWVKPTLEILAGIPTVVYGYFAILTISPFFRQAGEAIGLDVAAESALGAGFVMGIMIIPFISSLSDDIIASIPNALREASLGLGATKSETIRRVVLPAALPGVMGAVLLAVSRVIGETMIVVMAAGLAANLTFNPLDSVTTVTAQIVALLTGDQSFDSAKTLAAFGLGLSLFVFTLLLNIAALVIVKRYREAYE